MKTIRCFLAIKLDIDAVRSISRSQADLVEHCDTENISVRWVPPPNMHVTIRFLGQITEPMAYALKDMLAASTAPFPPFELTSAGLGVFPDLEHPNVIWAGCAQGSDQVEKLYSIVSERLVNAGFHLDNKPFRSHVTIGRVKSNDASGLEPLMTPDEPIFGQTFVRNLYCYQSDLTPKGAEYHAMWTLPLLGGTRQKRQRYQAPPERAVQHERNVQEEPKLQEEPKGEKSDDDNAG